MDFTSVVDDNVVDDELRVCAELLRDAILVGAALRLHLVEVDLESKKQFDLISDFLSRASIESIQDQSNKAAVEPMPHDREVMGSNPAVCWAFFLFSIPSTVCP